MQLHRMNIPLTEDLPNSSVLQHLECKHILSFATFRQNCHRQVRHSPSQANNLSITYSLFLMHEAGTEKNMYKEMLKQTHTAVPHDAPLHHPPTMVSTVLPISVASLYT